MYMLLVIWVGTEEIVWCSGKWWTCVTQDSVATPVCGRSRVMRRSLSGPALSTTESPLPPPTPSCSRASPGLVMCTLLCGPLSCHVTLALSWLLWRYSCWGMMYSFPRMTSVSLSCYSRASNHDTCPCCSSTDLWLSLLSTRCDASLPFFCLDWADEALAQSLPILSSRSLLSQLHPEVTITPSYALLWAVQMLPTGAPNMVMFLFPAVSSPLGPSHWGQDQKCPDFR